jgi:hypothetical protein
MSTVKVDAAAWQTVVASIYRELDGKDILLVFGPGISPKQEPISRKKLSVKTVDIVALLSHVKHWFIFVVFII